MLSSEYNVFTTSSGKKALELLQTEEFDLIISDVMMPHMSGYELTQKIREQFSISELPILLLTARNQLEDIHTGFLDRKSTRLNSSHVAISYAVFCLKKKKKNTD